MNTKHFILSLFTMVMPLVSMAQTTIGYTNETSNRINNFRLSTNTDQRLAMRLSKEKLQLLKGKTISGIKAAFGSKQSTNNAATLFISTSLDGDPVTTQEINISGSNKFYEYTLDTPYTITGDESELYIGAKMKIAASYGAFSADGSKDMEGVCFAYGKQGWQDMNGKGYGMPNIEAVLSETVDFTDLVIKPFSIDGYMKAGTPYSQSVELYNFGSQEINNPEFTISTGDKTITYSDPNIVIAPHKTYTLSLDSLSTSTVGMNEISVSALGTSVKTDAYFYPVDMEKNVLVEMFTGQTCTNCPSGHAAMTTSLANTGVKAVELVHHSGFQNDTFSMTEDWTLTSLYNSSTYAPACMINRTTFGSESSPVFDPQSVSTTSARLLEANNQKPYVSLSLSSEITQTTNTQHPSPITVHVTGKIYPHEQMPGDDIRYTLWLVQDSIIAAQGGAGSNFVHNATSRGMLTEKAFGESFSYTPGQEVVIEKDFVLPDTIVSSAYTKTDGKNHIATVLKNMKIILFVNAVSANDATACPVFNAVEACVGESTSQGGFPQAQERVLAKQTYYGDTQGYEKSDVATRTIDYAYDSQNRLVRKIETSKGTGTNKWELTHYYKNTYNSQDLLTKESALQYGQFDYGDLGFLPSNDSTLYAYNGLGQLVKETHPLKYYTFTYDADGRRLTRSTWNINSITKKAKNDLVETYSDFNSFGKPTKVTATSPTGKEWNEYVSTLEYDSDGNLISEVHVSNEGIRKYAEYWTYTDGILTEHSLPTVYDDGTELENEKEVFTPIDGNKNKIQRQVYLHESDGTWSTMAGNTRIDEYTELTLGAQCPTIELTPVETEINTAKISVSNLSTGDAILYRNGIAVDTLQNSIPWEGLEWAVWNGTYEYMLVQGNRASNLVDYTFHVDLPAVTNLRYVSKRMDFSGNTYVTLSWKNPDYDSKLGFVRNDLFFQNMQISEATTRDNEETKLEANFGPETVKTLFVQTVYKYGRVNSQPITIDLNNLPKAGDVNGDGTVDISDVNAIISVICGGEENSKADINNDGTVDISDVNAVISIICGG